MRAPTPRSSAPFVHARPFVLTVDVEPDVREIDRVRPGGWEGFRDCLPLLEDLRGRLEKRTARPVHFSWFVRMDPQIATAYGSASWPVEAFRRDFEALVARGDLLGLHAHAYRWDEEARGWVSDHGSPRWVEHCVASSVAAFSLAFERAPDSFRFGDHWMSNRTVAQLEHLGIRHDLTVEPGVRAIRSLAPSERSTGTLPDYRWAPRRPYQPLTFDYRVRGLGPLRRRLWMLPVSTGSVGEPGDVVALNFAFPPSWVAHLLDRALERQPVVVSVMRTGDASAPAARANLLRNIELLASHPGLDACVFTTPADAVARHVQRTRAAEAPRSTGTASAAPARVSDAMRSGLVPGTEEGLS